MVKNTHKRRRIAAPVNVSTDPRAALLTPQARTVLKHLSDAGTITQREALIDHSVQSLTRRITELRDAGFSVSGKWRTHPLTGQRYMRYTLEG